MIQKTTYKHPYLWISPLGDFYDGMEHESSARKILKEFYGVHVDYLDCGSDILIKKGWIKTNPEMNDHYESYGMYDHFASEYQKIAYYKWLDYYSRKTYE